MPTTEHIHLPLYTDEDMPDLSTTGHYNHAMEIIDANVGELESKASELANDLADELEARVAGDNALDAKLAAETKARTDADTALKGRIDTEVTERKAADNALGSRIDNAEANISNINWLTLRQKPFATIGTGLKVVSDALTVDTSALPSGITVISIEEGNEAADIYAKVQADWPNCVLRGANYMYPVQKTPDGTYLFSTIGFGTMYLCMITSTSIQTADTPIVLPDTTFGDLTAGITS